MNELEPDAERSQWLWFGDGATGYDGHYLRHHESAIAGVTHCDHVARISNKSVPHGTLTACVQLTAPELEPGFAICTSPSRPNSRRRKWLATRARLAISSRINPGR